MVIKIRSKIRNLQVLDTVLGCNLNTLIIIHLTITDLTKKERIAEVCYGNLCEDTSSLKLPLLDLSLFFLNYLVQVHISSLT